MQIGTWWQNKWEPEQQKVKLLFTNVTEVLNGGLIFAECREEFTARYLDGNIGKVMWGNVPKPNLIINLAEDEGPLSPAALAKLPPLDATLEEAKILGYKPHRDDFERVRTRRISQNSNLLRSLVVSVGIQSRS